MNVLLIILMRKKLFVMLIVINIFILKIKMKIFIIFMKKNFVEMPLLELWFMLKMEILLKMVFYF